MSVDIQAPGLSLNGRYSRGDEKNGGEKEESQVEIYENEVPLKHSHTDLWSHKFSKYDITTKYYTRKA